jgi:hypothetical protein
VRAVRGIGSFTTDAPARTFRRQVASRAPRGPTSVAVTVAARDTFTRAAT